MKTPITIFLFTLALVLGLALPSLAETTTIKSYFDVNIGIPQKLLTRLKLIDMTYDQLQATGRQPVFVIGFRGKASRFVTTGDDYVFAEDIAIKKEIRNWVKRFKERGIKMEQCLIAAGLQGVDPQDFLPEIKQTENGYVAMINYQTQGYAQVPMD